MRKREDMMGRVRTGRKGKLRRCMAVFVCILTTCLYAGCGSSGGADGAFSMATDKSSPSDMKNSAGGGMYSMEEAPEFEAADMDLTETGGDSSPGVLEGRKLIQTVGLEVETKEFEGMMSSLETQVEELGGYIESMETYNGSSYSDYVPSRYADLTVRVPNEKLNAFLQTVSDISNVVRRNDSVEDVTLSYVDMESRRNALRTEQERLLEFMEKAETIEEVIALEQRLSEVRYQLESMESQLRTMDNLIDYSTVEIHVSEVRELTDVREEEPGPGKRIAEGFMKSLRDIGDGILELAIWFLAHIPYLVIWAVAIAAAILFWKKVRGRRRGKKEARQREEEARLQAQRARMQEWENGGASANDGSKTPEQNQEPKK